MNIASVRGETRFTNRHLDQMVENVTMTRNPLFSTRPLLKAVVKPGTPVSIAPIDIYMHIDGALAPPSAHARSDSTSHSTAFFFALVPAKHTYRLDVAVLPWNKADTTRHVSTRDPPLPIASAVPSPSAFTHYRGNAL